MSRWVTVKSNGKQRAVKVENKREGFTKPISQKELNDMRRIGIKHPGSLTSLGYHVSEPIAMKHEALDRAVKTYGRTETLRKLAELYRLNVNRPNMKSKIAADMRFVSGKNKKEARTLALRDKENLLVRQLNAITKNDYPEDVKQQKVMDALNSFKAEPMHYDGTIFDSPYKLPGSKRLVYFNYADDDWDESKGRWDMDKEDR